MASNLRVDQILPSTSTNVAIGTATGSVTLVGSVSGTSITNSGVTTVAAGSTSAPSITPTGDSNTGIFFPSADTIAFGEGGAEAARFDSNGNLGIGTANPTTRLDVFVNGGEGIPSVVTGERMRIISNDISSRSTFASIIAGSSAYSGIFFGDKDSAEVGKIRYYHSDNSLQFYTNNTQNVILDTNGNLQIANGNLVFSTSGKGIDFSATANSSGTMSSELLDDYEEGNWTPGISGRTVTGSPAGVYTKIGREVTCYFEVNGLNSGITGTDIQMTGLPFTSGNASFDVDYTGWCQIGDIANVSFASGYGNLYGRVLVGTTNCQFLQQLISGSTHDAFTGGGGFASNFLIRGCIRYFTNT